MNTKRIAAAAMFMAASMVGMAQSKVYVTREITPESLINIYEALGRKASGRVAVKISTGEAGNPNYLKPELIGGLIRKVNGTIVECNTAYGGKRSSTEEHLKVAESHGYTKIAKVDIMDADGEIKIPVRDTSLIKYDLVGKNISNYDFMINLAHFKGHPMGGFGGVLKNQSIGIASARGKANIHTAGTTSDLRTMWKHTGNQDGFLMSMAAAAQGVADYYGDNIIYINVMNNMSVDCDCVSNPEAVKLKDFGILASLDPVALDQACIDIIFNMKAENDNNNAPLIERIKARHGTLTIDHAEKIGMGSKNYKLISIDKK